MASIVIMILNLMITILISNRVVRNTRSGTPGGRLRSALVAISLLVVACGGDAGSNADRPLIVATTSVWGDVVTAIVGDDADVVVLIPRGADSHDYEPAPRQVALLHEADLVVANGLGLEQGLTDVLASASTDGANIFEVAPLLDPIPFADHDHAHDHAEEGHDHGDLDPHVWLDLTRVAEAAGHIADRLGEVDGSSDWDARADAYAAALLDADQEASTILDAVEPAARRLVTNHEALGYFAHRFDFEIIGVVIRGGSTLAEPSSSELATLVETMRREGVNTIFVETTSPTGLAEAVAGEVGGEVSVVALHTESLGEPGSDADTLIGLLLSNARLVADALTG